VQTGGIERALHISGFRFYILYDRKYTYDRRGVEHLVKDYIDIYYTKDQKPVTSYQYKLIGHIIRKYNIAKKSKVLDLGCGRGDFLEPFKNADIDISGVDFAENSIRELKKRGYAVKQCDFEKNTVPFGDDYFDIVFSKSVIEHLSDPGKYLSEIKRILKPGGRLIIMTPDWYSQYMIFYNDHTHKQPYTLESLKNTLIESGFRDIDIRFFYQLPYLWKYPYLKFINSIIRWIWPKHIRSPIKLIRFSVELMLLAECSN
jgi:SAM-dependent methyltransferase